MECLGDRNGAIDKIRLAVSKEPTAQSYASLGRLYVDAGKVAEAEQALAEAEKLDPRWELTYVHRARLLISQSEYQAAMAQLQRALEINPSNVLARQLLGRLAPRVETRMRVLPDSTVNSWCRTQRSFSQRPMR